MGKHILRCECGREHDISEMFGRIVKEWLESGGRKIKNPNAKRAKEAIARLRKRNS